MNADVIVIGGGLAGLVASDEIARAGKRVLIVEQENEANLGGQAHWPFGGMFLVDSPMQRSLGVRDSFDLAWQDWQGSAAWDRLDGEHPEDEWAQQWGRAYVEFAATATPCPGSTSPGAPAPASPSRSSRRLAPQPSQVWCASPSGTRSTA
ncbi:Fumarate/succinate/L-aspartate dehydrogenase [Kocuria palustris PEL]|uniref:Fumarate/succinate/L-aspartate dehydrogenase n=1 Tax=Kocuria palustris PEL TaxID=1236550 RepID=M2YDR6_9MICC|nr:Fumarate/succinate/L-aspartate dehydrogenase [Kocuria palustris PEL]